MDRNRLCWRLGNLQRMHRSLVNRKADEAGVYMGQHHILRHISMHPGCTQNEVAAAMQQSAASISVTTRRLQEEGLIEKYPDENSLRINRLSITEKGRENGRKFLQVLTEYNERMFEGISEEELEELERLVDIMSANLEDCIAEVQGSDTQDSEPTAQ